MVSESAPSGPILDLEGALARLGNDPQLFAEMAGFLLEDVPKLFNELSAAVALNDAPAVRMKAHALKGLVAACGGVRAMNVSQALEDAGQSGDLSRAPALVTSLQSDLNDLTQAISQHLQ